MSSDSAGVLHKHEDGREHRHFSPGFTIGASVRPDMDGTEDHSHGTLGILSGRSGPAVWNERDGDLSVNGQQGEG